MHLPEVVEEEAAMREATRLTDATARWISISILIIVMYLQKSPSFRLEWPVECNKY